MSSEVSDLGETSSDIDRSERSCPASRAPPANSLRADERSDCACQNSGPRSSACASSSANVSCHEGRLFRACFLMQRVPWWSGPVTPVLVRSLLAGAAGVSSIATTGGCTLPIRVSIGRGGSNPPLDGVAATILARCCWQRSMSVSWLEQPWSGTQGIITKSE